MLFFETIDTYAHTSAKLFIEDNQKKAAIR